MYETAKKWRAGKDKIINKHDFRIINEKCGLVEIYQPVIWAYMLYRAYVEQQ